MERKIYFHMQIWLNSKFEINGLTLDSPKIIPCRCAERGNIWSIISRIPKSLCGHFCLNSSSLKRHHSRLCNKFGAFNNKFQRQSRSDVRLPAVSNAPVIMQNLHVDLWDVVDRLKYNTSLKSVADSLCCAAHSRVSVRTNRWLLYKIDGVEKKDNTQLDFN